MQYFNGFIEILKNFMDFQDFKVVNEFKDTLHYTVYIRHFPKNKKKLSDIYINCRKQNCKNKV